MKSALQCDFSCDILFLAFRNFKFHPFTAARRLKKLKKQNLFSAIIYEKAKLEKKPT